MVLIGLSSYATILISVPTGWAGSSNTWAGMCTLSLLEALAYKTMKYDGR